MSSKFLEKNSIIQDLKILLISCLIGIILISCFVIFGSAIVINNYPLGFVTRIFILPILLGIAISILYGYLSNSDLKQKLIFSFIFLFIFFVIDNFIGYMVSIMDSDVILMIFYSTLEYTLISFGFVLVGHVIKEFFNKNSIVK